MQAVYLVHGDDPSLVSARTSELLAELEAGEREFQPVPNDIIANDLMNMLCTPSLFSDEQVLVGRNLKAGDTGVVEAATRWLERPEEGTTLVLSFAGKAPAELVKKVKDAGMPVITLSVPTNQAGRRALVEEMISSSGLRLDARARAYVLEVLGEEINRLPALLELLRTQYSETTITEAMLEPLIGEAGGIPLWELTDAIDAGNPAKSLAILSRLLQAGKAEVQLQVVVQNHFDRMFRLSMSGITSEKTAAEFLGMKGSTFPAKKALQGARAWGSERLITAMALNASAATDVRGGSALPPRLLMEILVARLAMLRRA